MVGAAFLGHVQDRVIERELHAQNPALHAQVVSQEKVSVFGSYRPLDQEKLQAVSSDDLQLIAEVQSGAKKDALMTVAILPLIMLAGYLILMAYFKRTGGYRARLLDRPSSSLPET